MVKINGYLAEQDGTISPEYINVIQRCTSYNKIELKYEGDIDFFTLQMLCDRVRSTPNATECSLTIPYLPHTYGPKVVADVQVFRSIAKIINDLKFRGVYVTEAAPIFPELLIERFKNTDLSYQLAQLAMRDEMNLVGSCWFTKRSHSSSTGDTFCLEGMYDTAKKDGIYMLYASNFNKYNMQIGYDNLLDDVGSYEDDCSKVIVVDDVCDDIAKYEMIAEQLRVSMPSLESIVVCVTHCLANPYGSDLINKKKISRFITTNSVLKEKSYSDTSDAERETMKVLNAYDFKLPTAKSFD